MSSLFNRPSSFYPMCKDGMGFYSTVSANILINLISKLLRISYMNSIFTTVKYSFRMNGSNVLFLLCPTYIKVCFLFLFFNTHTHTHNYVIYISLKLCYTELVNLDAAKAQSGPRGLAL